MSVQNQTVKNVYEGNGSTTVFPFTFALNEDDGEYVGVYVTNDEGTSETTSNYTINTTAKTVTYPRTGSPLATGKKLTIIRELPNEQNLNLENLGPFFADDVEDEMDREVMLIQQLAEQVDRAVKVDVTDDLPSASVIYDINHVREYKNEAYASKTAAAASATAAAASKASAAASETAAATSKTNAAASAAAALNSQNAAATSATSASSSATSANSSKLAAATSETNAAASETAAAASAAAAALSKTNASASELAAAASETNAAASEIAAATSETNSAASATLAQKWAESTSSPDGETDTDSDTGLTQSARTWALASKADSLYADEIATQLEGIVAPLAWDPTETYNYPDIVAYTDGRTYRCVGTNVTGIDVPGESLEWITMMYGLSAFELDMNGDLMPCASIFDDSNWELDAQGNLMPVA